MKSLKGISIFLPRQFNMLVINVENLTHRFDSSVNKSYFTKTDHSTHCPWKGDASYYTINLDKTELKNAAWYYPEVKEKAKNIENYVAFYTTMVTVTTSE
ncbi:DUF427 domain-containing protein [Phlyctema vagabunda]|uniref:DUF427 domain-containing protein n=1 Tax=Phlyctema vagabunda TaxID=108571 RepID=A0ABR4PA32_9HELO